MAYANILVNKNKAEDAKKIVLDLWRKRTLSRKLTDQIIEKHKDFLSDGDYFFKAQQYLYRSHRKYINRVKKISKHLSAEKRKVLEDEIALLKNNKKTVKKTKALISQKKLPIFITYLEARKLSRKKKYKEAWELLKMVPNKPELLVATKKWWRLKRPLIHEAINQKQYKIAYEMAKNHGQSLVNQLNDAEFLAGWIAYRFLKEPKTAYPHFVALSNTADGPRSSSRAHYWMGRTALAQGYKVKAKQHFRDGAKYFNTFYGQLAKQSMNLKDQHVVIEKLDQPTKNDIKSFVENDVVKAVVLAHKAGKKAIVSRFIAHLRYQFTKPGEMILLADLAKQLGQNQQSLRVGKTALFRGYKAAEYAYPTHVIPDFKPLTSLPEPAFYFAISRQESEFNTQIKSHAGARGLMQVMPATARYLARKFNMVYSRNKLTQDPSYNVQLGTAYIAGRLKEFTGSYIKTIAGFNAGPGNVMKWVKKYGDPNDPKIDPIDWIERIPFKETRNYVKKVLANMQVYRARLGNSKTALQIHKDLARGRKQEKTTYSPLIAYN